MGGDIEDFFGQLEYIYFFQSAQEFQAPWKDFSMLPGTLGRQRFFVQPL
jgi:hypothetical protein